LSAFEQVLQDCESDVRSGRADLAAKRLRQLNPKNVPPESHHRVASLCRRIGLVSLGMKFLTPKTLNDRAIWLREASPQEIAEYAVLLQRIGSVNEAMTILETLDGESQPEALLYRTYCHVNRWEYSESIPLLERYVTVVKDQYKNLIGRVNLAAALVATDQLEPSIKLLRQLLEENSRGGFQRLHANCCEMLAKVAISQNDFKGAKEYVDAAKSVLGSQKTVDELFVRKSEAIIAAMTQGSLKPLEDFRAQAAKRGEWESVREVDFFSLKLRFSESDYRYLAFGTPFQSYRARLLREFGKVAYADWYVLGNGEKLCMDVMSGCGNEGRPMLEIGSKVHQSVEILLRDFYRPLPLGSLHAELFPGEHFNIFSSPDRVHQVLRRTRLWAKKANFPVAINQDHRGYSLKLNGSAAFVVPFDREAVDWQQIQMRKFRRFASADRIYGASEIRRALELTTNPFKRFTAQAVRDGVLERVGSGSATAYRLRGA
jgi:tetratricopeptide (TPR) repeat protein